MCFNKPTLRCTCGHMHCREKVNTVCGNDGVTYKSVCHLQKTECKLRGFIGLDYFGACKEPPNRRKWNPLSNERRHPYEKQLYEENLQRAKKYNMERVLLLCGIKDNATTQNDTGHNTTLDLPCKLDKTGTFPGILNFHSYQEEINYVTSPLMPRGKQLREDGTRMILLVIVHKLYFIPCGTCRPVSSQGVSRMRAQREAPGTRRLETGQGKRVFVQVMSSITTGLIVARDLVTKTIGYIYKYSPFVNDHF